MEGDDDILLRFVRGMPNDEDVAAVTAALLLALAMRPGATGDDVARHDGIPPSWDEPEVFRPPTSWLSR
jgi:hypothetical protein